MIKGFPPIARSDATASTLILGSMPSVTSLQKRRVLWSIEAMIFGQLSQLSFMLNLTRYQQKIDTAH